MLAENQRTGLALVNTLKNLLRSSRPKQSAKNGLVLVPLFFTINIWWDSENIEGDLLIVAKAFITFGAFSALSAAVYFFNDLLDIEQDRVHPKKKHRPIAAGLISPQLAWTTAAVLTALGLTATAVISFSLLGVSAGYVVLNIAYTTVLKHQVILDVMSVAAGFVLRAVAGTLAINGSEFGIGGLEPARMPLNISPWLYVVTALGALFIALVKRRSELVSAGDVAENQRAILREYSAALLDQLIVIVAASTLMAYTLYTFSSGITESSNVPENNTMMLTIPFVAYGLFRYLYLMHKKGGGEAPEEVLLTDLPMQLNIALWLATGAIVLILNA